MQPLVNAADPPPVVEARRAGRFPCIDGYRAIAALAVVFVHLTFTSGLTLRNRTIGPFAARLEM